MEWITWAFKKKKGRGVTELCAISTAADGAYVWSLVLLSVPERVYFSHTPGFCFFVFLFCQVKRDLQRLLLQRVSPDWAFIWGLALLYCHYFFCAVCKILWSWSAITASLINPNLKVHCVMFWINSVVKNAKLVQEKYIFGIDNQRMDLDQDRNYVSV